MMDETGTIARALNCAAGALAAASPTPRLDAELLLAHVLGWSRARLLAEGRARLDSAHQTAFDALVARRRALEPVAYLTGHREFFGLDFEVNPAVLVPRPETELLVELSLAAAGRRTKDEGRTQHEPSSFVLRPSSLLIADIGTGSGAIAVTLATQLPAALVYAVDLSPAALEVAGRNAVRHGVAERVRLLQGDLLAPLPEPVDLLISNPPYTVLSEIDENVRRHEPHLALDGGPDGLVIYRRLLAQAPAHLRPGGTVLLEIGATQGQAVAALAREHFPAARVSVHQDLAGLDRVVAIETRRHGDTETRK